MLLAELIAQDNRLTNKVMMKQRIKDLEIRTSYLITILNKSTNKTPILALITQNRTRIANLFKKVVD